MIIRFEVWLRKIRRLFSRSEWAISLLKLSRLKASTSEPGLVLIQIDGLSLYQFQRAMKNGSLPFLSRLLGREHYLLHPFYSGLPSNTPSVQGEIFYGVKSCVPAFHFVDRGMGKAIKMFDAWYVEQFEDRLKEKGEGLLSGGSSYSNIYTGGTSEAHFCFGKMGWSGIRHAIRPWVFPFLVILYIDIFARTLALLVVEFFLALFEFLRGAFQGRVLSKEIEMLWLRTLVCVVLREFIVAGASMDIRRGLPIIHLNFLGYDEQAHCRGPSSNFAHWALRGIDYAIERIYNVVRESQFRHYDVWVYADHGQEKTTPYVVKYGRTLEEAVDELFETAVLFIPHPRHESTRVRAALLKRKAATPSAPLPFPTEHSQVMVTAMGPFGHIYVKKQLSADEMDFYAAKLVKDLKIPLVLTKTADRKLRAWTPEGTFNFPTQATEVLGAEHPFLQEIQHDLLATCFHPDAGEFVIGGWSKGQDPISFTIEFGAHTGIGPQETASFALLPVDAPTQTGHKEYLRPLDLRAAAQNFLGRAKFSSPSSANAGVKTLRVMSYNVHGCLGTDGAVSINRIARVVARYNPDIIALQELDAGRQRSGGIHQAQHIARILQMQFYFHPVWRYGDEEYGNAILSRYPISLVKMGPLPCQAEEKKFEPRGVIWVNLEFQDVNIQVFNTHLSMWATERLIQTQALLGAQWLGHPDLRGPVVVCGDFNASPGSMVYSRICRRFKDSQACLNGHAPISTWFGRFPLSRIDHVFLDERFQVSSVAVPRSSLERSASDHLPLIVDVNLV